MKATLWIAWIAIRELLYERVFYLLVLFSLLGLGLSAMLGQMTYAEQSKLTLDFMLGAVEISLVLFSVFMGISLFHRELSMGSVSMILSKPISRSSFLLGKFLGQCVVQTVVIFLMGIIIWFGCSRYEELFSPVAIFQTMLLTSFQVVVITAITYLFAVVSGAVTTSLATLTLFALGHLREGVAENLDKQSKMGWGIVKQIIPNLEIFNMKALASYGLSVPGTEIAWAALYAICCLVFFLAAALLFFQNRDIQT